MPDSGNAWTLDTAHMTDTALCDTTTGICPYPADLVAASNASQNTTGIEDLIGVLANSSGGNELALFSAAVPGGYSFDYPALSTAAPGGDNWQNYTLASAQPGCYQQNVTACNQGNITLFALDKTGALWKTTTITTTTTGQGAIGPWSSITPVPWGSKPPATLSADINASGQTELWAQSGTTITAYTLTGTTLSAGNSQTSNAPLGEWPLTDGSNLVQPGATTASDTVSGGTAALNGGASWNADDYFSTDLLNGQNGYVTPSANTIPSSNATPKISIWFKTTTPARSSSHCKPAPFLPPGRSQAATTP